jgi:hypothetical protein
MPSRRRTRSGPGRRRVPAMPSRPVRIPRRARARRRDHVRARRATAAPLTTRLRRASLGGQKLRRSNPSIPPAPPVPGHSARGPAAQLPGRQPAPATARPPVPVTVRPPAPATARPPATATARPPAPATARPPAPATAGPQVPGTAQPPVPATPRPPGGSQHLPLLQAREPRAPREYQARSAQARPSTAGTRRSSGPRTARSRPPAESGRTPVGLPIRRTRRVPHRPPPRTFTFTGMSATRRRRHQHGRWPPTTPPTGMTCWRRNPFRSVRIPAARSSR